MAQERPPLVIDLFAGTGSATEPFRRAGWEVVRVELDPSFPAEYHADVSEWHWHGRRPDLIWASPPCTEFARESMPWCRTGKTPSLALVEATRRVIAECDPVYWAIENVKGSTRYLTPILGAPLCLGPVRLYGNFPRHAQPPKPWLHVQPWKERLSSKNKKGRATMPPCIGEGLRQAIEECLFWQIR